MNHLQVWSIICWCDLIDFIIKQVWRTRPMIADDECYSLTWIMCRVWSMICWCDLNKITYGSDDDEGYSITCINCWCDQSSAGAISIRSHMVWMTMKVTQSHPSFVGASDQSCAGAISIRGHVHTPNVLALAFPKAFCSISERILLVRSQ